VIIEGPPGIGKTALAQALAHAIGGSSKRLQFTPDLMPSDIVGYSIYQQHIGDFKFIKGPVFSNVLLADEINRTSPRVQSALLEAMSEQSVSVDGVTHQLEQPFFVIATQNNLSYVGTFPLPEPQLDRFILSIPMSLPSKDIQHEILMHGVITPIDKPVINTDEILELQKQSSSIKVSDELAHYVVNLCEELRLLAGGSHTVSVRGSLAVLSAAKAKAMLEDKSFVTPDHVQAVFPYVMQHRLIGNDTIENQSLIIETIKKVPIT